LKILPLQILMRLLGALPWAWLRGLGRGLGYLLWRVDSREKFITATNIALCLPELDAAARARLVRASLLDFGQTALEMPKMWCAPAATVLAAITAIDGLDVLERARAAGRGVLILAPHHGNWEAIGVYLGHHYGVTSMYLPTQNAAMTELVRVARSRSGSTLVPADTGGVRALLKALRRGELVGVLPDQVPKQAGAEFAPFFGAPALTMTLASNLLQKTGAIALLSVALRLPDGGFRLIFREPDAELYHADTARSLAALNRSVEALVREHPAQYQWEYKRFKARVEGAPDIYKRGRD
jgi:KDO2-lipid IV(A) lauroyltransferase